MIFKETRGRVGRFSVIKSRRVYDEQGRPTGATTSGVSLTPIGSGKGPRYVDTGHLPEHMQLVVQEELGAEGWQEKFDDLVIRIGKVNGLEPVKDPETAKKVKKEASPDRPQATRTGRTVSIVKRSKE